MLQAVRVARSVVSRPCNGRHLRCFSVDIIGAGGYASNQGKNVTVFGATGFLGRYVVAVLAGQGYNIIIPYRGDDSEVRHLKLMGDLGKVGFIPFDARDTESVRAAIKPADIVVNLIGKEYETRHIIPIVVNYTFPQVNVEIPRLIAEICTEQQKERLIHVSSLSANPKSVSEWSRTKFHGERVVRAAYPSATIVRPADIFGDEDRFLNWIAENATQLPRSFLIDDGKALAQPVFVKDVAMAVNAILKDENSPGNAYNLAGPEVFSRKEISEFVFRTIFHRPKVLDLPVYMLQAFAKSIELIPRKAGRKIVTIDQINQALEDNVLGDRANDLETLGVAQTSMEFITLRYLNQYRFGSQFLDIVDN